MVNVLESLVIQLGLDTKGVTNGAKKVERDLKDVEDQADKTADALDKNLGPAGARVEGSLKKVSDASSKTGKTLDKTLTPSGARVEGILHRIGVSGENMGKVLGGAGATAADGFSKARNQALALMAVFTAGRGLKAFVQQTTEANAQLGYTAQRLNVNPQRLWAASHAVVAMGGSEGEVAGALGNIQQMQSTPEGSARLANIFGQLGVRNYQEDIRNGPEALLRDINRTTQGMDQGRKNNLLGQLGFGAGMINTVDQTTAAFDKLIASKQKLAPTNEEISNSQKLLTDLRQLADVNDHFGRVLENEVAPAIDKIVVAITQWEQANPGLVKEIGEITLAVVGLGSALGTIGAAKGALGILGMLRGGSGGAGLGLLGRAGTAGAIGAALWHPTDAGGSVERFIQSHGGDSKATRWFFGDRQKGSAKQALSILQGMGFSRNAALGIAGNISQESGFDPTRVGDNGSAFGIGQWHKDRADAILKQTGIDVRTANFADQVKAYGLELQSGSDAGARKAGRMLGASNISVMDAVHAVRAYGERPANRLGNEDAIRYNQAIRIAGAVPSSSGGNSTQIGDVHIHVQGNADGTKIAQDFKTEIRRSLPIQNIYGQA